MYFGYWNIRGLLDPLRRVEVRKWALSSGLCLVGLLETKVPEYLFGSLSSSLLSGWTWIANYDSSPGGKVWIGLDPSLVCFEVISSNDQVIHGRVRLISTGSCCCVSVVYAQNSFVLRRPLWVDLIRMSSCIFDLPWMVAGDFNALRDPSDRLGGTNAWPPSFDEFNQCLHQAELEDLRYVGLRFTWSTSSGANWKARKIDRVLVNALWSLYFSYSEASLLPFGISDHSPMVVKVIQPVFRRKPFKFFDFWMEHPSFKDILTQVWQAPSDGVPIFRLVTKLKALKGRLKQLNRDSFSNLSERVAQSRNALRLAQVVLQHDHTNVLLAELEKNHRRTFVELRSQEEAFFRQKSRIRWLEMGDKITKYFHHSVTTRQLRNFCVLATFDIAFWTE